MFEGRKRTCTLCSLAMQPHPWVGYTISVNPVANAFVPFFVSSNQPPSAQFHLRKSMSLSQERLSSTGLVLEFNIFSKLVRKQLNCIFLFCFHRFIIVLLLWLTRMSQMSSSGTVSLLPISMNRMKWTKFSFLFDDWHFRMFFSTNHVKMQFRQILHEAQLNKSNTFTYGNPERELFDGMKYSYTQHDKTFDGTCPLLDSFVFRIILSSRQMFFKYCTLNRSTGCPTTCQWTDRYSFHSRG